MNRPYVISFGESEIANIAQLDKLPTVCIFLIREPLNSIALEKAVKACIDVGAVFFLCCGDAADMVEDEIDAVLETLSADGYSVSTTTHQQESNEEMANFAVHSCYIEDAFFRCLVFFDGLKDFTVNSLIEEIDLQILLRDSF